MGINWSDARLETVGGIPYKLIEGPSGSINEAGGSIKERYIIQASNLEAFINESIPPPQVFGGFVVKGQRRALPGSTVFFTKRVDFAPHTGQLPADPLGADSGAPAKTYDGDLTLDIEYELGLADDDEVDPNDPETFLEHSVNVAGEFLNVPTKNLDAKDSDVNGSGSGEQKAVQSPADVVSKVIANLEHTLSWKFALKPNWTTIIKALGTVNAAALPILLNAPAETVLFAGVSGRQEYVWTGAKAPNAVKIKPWSLDFKFLHKQIEDDGNLYSWQHCWIANEHKWRKILRQPGDRPLYETSDHLALFKP